MQFQPLSESELQDVEGGYTNRSAFSTQNKVLDGFLIGAAGGLAFGGVGAAIGGVIGAILGWLF